MASVLLIVSPWTYAIDDIQVYLLDIGGGFLVVLFCRLWLRSEVELPHRRIVLPLAGWFAAMLISMTVHQTGMIPHANHHQ